MRPVVLRALCERNQGGFVADVQFQILPLTELKRSPRRSFLGRIEHVGTRFIVTDYGQAVAEFGPLSELAAQFLARSKEPKKEPKKEPEKEREKVRREPARQSTRTGTAKSVLRSVGG